MTLSSQSGQDGIVASGLDSSRLEERLEKFFLGLCEVVAPVQDRLEEEAGALPDRLSLFFSGLAPAVEVASAAQAELDRRLATQFSVFDDFFHFIHKKENTLSRIFRTLLDPAGPHGQGTRFLNALLVEVEDAIRPAKHGDEDGSEDVRSAYGVLPSVDAACRVHTEYGIRKTDGERGSIDIVIEWPLSSYWIGIENKPRPGEQPRQIAEYLEALSRKGGVSKVLLLYFSGSGEDPTTLPTDEDMAARCITLPYRSGESGPSVEGWLRRCRQLCEAERVRWFLLEIEDHITRSFDLPMASSNPQEDEDDEPSSEHDD